MGVYKTRVIPLLASLAAGLTAIPVASATGLPALPSAISNEKVGSWAEYDVTVDGKKTAKLRVTLVRSTGANAELQVQDLNNKGVTLGIEIGGDLVVRGLAVKATGVKPMLLPPELVKGSGGAVVDATSFKADGSETIKTPAGSFECQRYLGEKKGEAVSACLSAAIGPLGLIRAASRLGNREQAVITLTGNGAATAATTLFTGAPFNKEAFQKLLRLDRTMGPAAQSHAVVCHNEGWCTTRRMPSCASCGGANPFCESIVLTYAWYVRYDDAEDWGEGFCFW